MSETLISIVITALLSSGGMGGLFIYLGGRSTNKVTAEGQLMENYRKQVESYEKQSQIAEQRASALALEQSEMRGRFEAKIEAIEQRHKASLETLEHTNDEQFVKLNGFEWRVRELEREVEEYKRCSSAICPFRRIA